MRWASSAFLIALISCTKPPRFEPAGPLELLANIDDDDGDSVRDGLDSVMNGPADQLDFRRVTLDGQCRGDVALRLEPPSAAEHVHVFDEERLVLGGTVTKASVPCDVRQLFIEARRTRSSLWDGRVTLIAGTSKPVSLELRVAPVVFGDVTKPARRVFAVNVDDSRASENTALLEALRATGVPLNLAPGAAHFFERWMQDAISAGRQTTDAGALDVLLQMDRPTGVTGLERFAASRLGRDVGLALPGRDEPTVLSYGGNVEVIPPHRGFPAGRLVVGGTEQRRMGRSTLGWLNAQEAQAPVLELDTEWLETGHIDEVLAFVPSDGGWTGFIASPRLAAASLDGGVPDSFNERIALRLDAVSAQFTRETGVSLVELPQRFAPNDAGLAVASHPSTVNLISLGGVALTAECGSELEAVVEARLRAAGVRAVFVDAGAYHPHGGGLHCGVEVQR